MSKSIKYMGRVIESSAWEGSKKYFVEVKDNSTGIPYDEKQSPQFDTIKAAKEYIKLNH